MVICMNEAHRIDACLKSLSFCDEIVVIDSGSTDGTLDIVRAHGARLLERPFRSMNDQKDFGREAARGEWVLNIDADEVVSEPLQQEIREAIRADSSEIAGYQIPFRNYFRSAWVRRCGYYPDPHTRLVKKERARWDKDFPSHDRVLLEGALGDLRGHIDHYSFDSIEDFVQKSCRYAGGFAQKAYKNGRRASAWTIAVHTFARFFKAYVLKAGFLEGALGLTISGLQAYEAFQKYVRLWELSRFGPSGREGGEQPR